MYADRVKMALGNALIKMESSKDQGVEFSIVDGMNDLNDRLVIQDLVNGGVYVVRVEKL